MSPTRKTLFCSRVKSDTILPIENTAARVHKQAAKNPQYQADFGTCSQVNQIAA